MVKNNVSTIQTIKTLFTTFAYANAKEISQTLESKFDKDFIEPGNMPIFSLPLLSALGFPPLPPFRIKVSKLFKLLRNSDNLPEKLRELHKVPYSLLLLSYFYSFLFPLSHLYTVLGINQPVLPQTMAWHNKQLILWLFCSYFLFLILLPIFTILILVAPLFIIILIFAPILSLFSILDPGGSNQLLSQPNPFLMFFSGFSITVYYLYLTYIFLALPTKITFRIINYYFAETLALKEIIYILLELDRDDILVDKNKKKSLLYRMNYLSNTIQLLKNQYLRLSKNNQTWISEHFENIEYYLKERERWVIMPRETTLRDLKQDFHYLLGVFANLNYGNFEWSNSKYIPEKTKKSRFRNFVSILTRLISIVIPLILMGSYLLNPALYPFIHLDVKTVSYVFFAWLILTLDINLNLGVASGLVNLAKGLKELA